MLSQKTFALKGDLLKGENFTGSNWSKVRLTSLVTANMDGSDKQKLMVIKKSNNL